jgi:hypothetical protein
MAQEIERDGFMRRFLLRSSGHSIQHNKIRRNSKMLNTFQGVSTENPSQVDSTTGETQQASPINSNRVIEFLLGASYHPFMRKFFEDMFHTLCVERLYETPPLMYWLTEEPCKRDLIQIGKLRRSLESFSNKHYEEATKFVDLIENTKFYKMEDAYLKGLVDGMEMQSILQESGQSIDMCLLKGGASSDDDNHCTND